MAFLPLRYNARSLFWRRSATLFTVCGIGATVAVVAGILCLQQGFTSLYTDVSESDVAVFLRPGANSEGESSFPRQRADVLMKTLPEIAEGPDGRPLASGEMYLAVLREKVDGGKTNVAIRGVQPPTFDILGDRLQMNWGRRFQPGTDEVMVGSSLVGRIQDCGPDQVILINTTPCRVVGIFESVGPFASEIWGDADRLSEALDRSGFQRIIARLKQGVDMEEFAKRLEDHQEVPAKVLTEEEYFRNQTSILRGTLEALGVILGAIMGIAAIFTGVNTMLAALAARTHEIGILLSVGFRPVAIFFSFLLEASFLGLLGGVVGCLAVLPLHGVETGTTNFATFTEVAFAFRVTPYVLLRSFLTALALGMFAGAWPAFRAASLRPTEALRRG